LIDLDRLSDDSNKNTPDVAV